MRVEILDGKEKAFEHRKAISKLGFWYIKNKEIDGRWSKECKESEIAKIKKFCKRHHLEYAVYEEGFTRSSNYRYRYFKAHKGLFNTFYQCAYCGRIRTKKYITVDHIIPVDKVIKGKRREHYKRLLRSKGITDINDVRNLVSACRRCNSQKSANAGIWILRGRIGSHPWFWVTCNLILIVVLIFVVCNISEIAEFFKNLFLSWISELT